MCVLLAELPATAGTGTALPLLLFGQILFRLIFFLFPISTISVMGHSGTGFAVSIYAGVGF